MTECEHTWEEIEDLYALTRLAKNGGQVSFMPDTGIPIVISICNKCGEIKIFSAKVKGKF